MNVYGHRPVITFDMEGNAKLTVDILPESKLDLLNTADYIMQSKYIALDIKRSFRHRSLDANSMFWALLERLADAVEVTNDEMYLKLLSDYGAFVIENVAEYETPIDEIADEKGYRIVERLGEITVGGFTVTQYRCFPGTSKYNTKEMSRLIKGTLYECESLGIPTESSKDIKEALDEWGKKDNE